MAESEIVGLLLFKSRQNSLLSKFKLMKCYGVARTFFYPEVFCGHLGFGFR